MNTVYIISYTETTVDEYGNLNTEHGTFDYGYEDENEAIAMLKKAAEEKYDEYTANKNSGDKADLFIDTYGDSASVSLDHATGCDSCDFTVAMVSIL